MYFKSMFISFIIAQFNLSVTNPKPPRMMSLSANYRPFLSCIQGQPEPSRFCVMKFGRDVTVDDGDNYFTFHERNVRIKIKNK